MKSSFILLAILSLSFSFFRAHAEEETVQTTTPTEYSPVIPAAEGERELTLDNESPAKDKATKPKETKMDPVCKAEEDPNNCSNKKTTKKKVLTKKPVFAKKALQKKAKDAGVEEK